MLRQPFLSFALVAALAVSVPPSASAQQNPLSRIGGKLAYISTDDDLMVLDGATGNRRVLVSGVNQQLKSPRWSPDGREIAYLSSPKTQSPYFTCDRCYVRDFDVYTVLSTGGAPRRITDELKPMYYVDWLPDGRNLIYEFGFNNPPNLVVVDSNGMGSIASYPRQGSYDLGLYGGVGISRNTARVAFLSDRAPMPCQLEGRYTLVVASYTLDDMTGLHEQCGISVGRHTAPAWTPDDSAISFVEGVYSCGADNRSASISAQLREVRLDGTGSRVVFEVNGGLLDSVSYSPDGTMIALVIERDGGCGTSNSKDYGPVVVRRDGTEVSRLPGMPSVGDLQWSNDSSVFMFTAMSGSSDGNAVYLAPVHGGRAELVVRLAQLGEFHWHP